MIPTAQINHIILCVEDLTNRNFFQLKTIMQDAELDRISDGVRLSSNELNDSITNVGCQLKFKRMYLGLQSSVIQLRRKTCPEYLV
jgi:hypothetical protein